MEIETALLNFIVYKNGDPELPEITSKRLDSLSVEEQRGLFGHAIHWFRTPVIEEILATYNYFSPEKIKEIKGVQFTEKDKIYSPRNYSWNEFSLGKPLSDFDLSRLGADFYVKVSPPKSIQNQIDAYQKRIADKKIQNEEKKKERKIKKAEKLLKEAGKL